MNSIPDCFARSSKEATRSSAGRLIDCVDASAESAMAGADNNAQMTNPAKAQRCVEVVKIGDSPKVLCSAGFPMRLAFGQNSAVTALLDVDREAALHEP